MREKLGAGSAASAAGSKVLAVESVASAAEPVEAAGFSATVAAVSELIFSVESESREADFSVLRVKNVFKKRIARKIIRIMPMIFKFLDMGVWGYEVS